MGKPPKTLLIDWILYALQDIKLNPQLFTEKIVNADLPYNEEEAFIADISNEEKMMRT